MLAALDRVTVQFGIAPLVDHEWITIATAKVWYGFRALPCL